MSAGNHAAALRLSAATRDTGTWAGSWPMPSGSPAMPMLVGRSALPAAPLEGQRRVASERSTPLAGGFLRRDEAAEDMSEAGIGLHRTGAVVQRSIPGLKAVAAVHHEIGGRVVGRTIQLQLCTQCEVGGDLVLQCAPE